MDDLEATILDAALQVFSRYGVKRSSMGDLCQAAGVSRQTLYNRFRNKDAILRGMICRYTDQAIAEITETLAEAGSLAERLDMIFDRMVVGGYDTVQAMPNAQEFLDGVNGVSQDAQDDAASRFRAVIAEVLAEHQPALARAGLTVEELADFVQRAAKCAGLRSRDRAHLMTQLATLRQLCVSAAARPETSQ